MKGKYKKIGFHKKIGDEPAGIDGVAGNVPNVLKKLGKLPSVKGKI